MKESKIALTDRLRREGSWYQAAKFKQETLSQCPAKGIKRGEARNAAWEAMERVTADGIHDGSNERRRSGLSH